MAKKKAAIFLFLWPLSNCKNTEDLYNFTRNTQLNNTRKLLWDLFSKRNSVEIYLQKPFISITSAIEIIKSTFEEIQSSFVGEPERESAKFHEELLNKKYKSIYLIRLPAENVNILNNLTKTDETFKKALLESFESRFSDFESYKIFEVLKLDEIIKMSDDLRRKIYGRDEIKSFFSYMKGLGVYNFQTEVDVFLDEQSSIKNFVYANCKGKTNFFQKLKKNLIFPNFNPIFSYYLTLPIGTVSVERGFSEMNKIKTELRNGMGDDLLSALLMIRLNGPMWKDLWREPNK